MTMYKSGHGVHDKLNSGYYAQRPKPRDDYLSIERAAYRKEAFASEEDDEEVEEDVVEEVLDETAQFALLYDTKTKHHQRQAAMKKAGVILGMGVVSDSIKDAVITGVEHPSQRDGIDEKGQYV